MGEKVRELVRRDRQGEVDAAEDAFWRGDLTGDEIKDRLTRIRSEAQDRVIHEERAGGNEAPERENGSS